MYRNVAVLMGMLLVMYSAVVRSQDVVFYDGFESGDTAGWWAPARVGETGQRTCYATNGTVIACSGTGQDGDLQTGVAWPNPRFVNKGDGTVTDMLTGLIWLRDASCANLAGTDVGGKGLWATALTASAALASGTCGLSDSSVAGDWHLPSVNELQSLVHYGYYNPSLSDATGTTQWNEGNAFWGVQANAYWSSTSSPSVPTNALYVVFYAGHVVSLTKTGGNIFVWPVRGGQ